MMTIMMVITLIIWVMITFNLSTYSLSMADFVVLLVLLLHESVRPPTVDFFNAFGAYSNTTIIIKRIIIVIIIPLAQLTL